MLLERGDSGDGSRVTALVHAALSDYRAFGMRGYTAEAERMLADARFVA